MLRRSDAFLATKVNDELVMLNAATGDFIGLTATAAAVWDRLEAPASVEQICRHLEDQFAVDPAQCRAEVGDLVIDLVARGVLLDDQVGVTLAWASDQSSRRWAALVAMARRACDERPDKPEPHMALVELLIGARRWAEADVHMALFQRRFPDHSRIGALADLLAQETGDGALARLVRAVATARTSGSWDEVAALCDTISAAQGGSARRHYAAVAAARLAQNRNPAHAIDAPRDSFCQPLPRAARQETLSQLLTAIDHHSMLDQQRHPVATRKAWQSELLAPLDHPAVATLFTAVQQAIDAFLASRPWLLPPPQLGTWTINGWAVRYPAQGHQASHFHPDAWLSAVFAVATPPGSQAVLRLGALDGGPDADLGAPWPIVELAMQPGDLVIFPSWIPHASTSTRVPGERVVIAVDVVPQGGWQHD